MKLIQCPYPGCFRTLRDTTVSGTCREHNHAIGYCRCPTCAKKGNVPPEEVPPPKPPPLAESRADIIQAEIPQFGTTSQSGDPVRISLKRAPWE